MTSDLDIYRTASVLVREHGEDAALEAAHLAVRCWIREMWMACGAEADLYRNVMHPPRHGATSTYSFVGFHSRASRCASAICARVMRLVAYSRFRTAVSWS